MDFKEIQELIKLVEETKMSEVKIEQGDFKILIRSKAFAEAKAQATAPTTTIMSAPIPPVAAPIPTQIAAPPVEVVPQTTPSQEAGPSTASEVETASAANLITIKSPMIGTFYRSSSPDKPPFVKVGDVIEPGSVICIVEAMKLFNEIEAEVSGKVVKVFAENSSPVEYDTPLFQIEAS